MNEKKNILFLYTNSEGPDGRYYLNVIKQKLIIRNFDPIVYIKSLSEYGYNLDFSSAYIIESELFKIFIVNEFVARNINITFDYALGTNDIKLVHRLTGKCSYNNVHENINDHINDLMLLVKRLKMEKEMNDKTSLSINSLYPKTMIQYGHIPYLKDMANRIYGSDIFNYCSHDVEITSNLFEELNKKYFFKNECKLPEIINVIYNYPATIVFWSDGTKTVVKIQDDEPYDPEKGLSMAISKKYFGNKGNYYEVFKKWIPEDEENNIGPSSLVECFENINKFSKQLTDAINSLGGRKNEK